MRRIIVLSFLLGLLIFVLSLFSVSAASLSFNMRWVVTIFIHVVLPLLIVDVWWFALPHSFRSFFLVVVSYFGLFLMTGVIGMRILIHEGLGRVGWEIMLLPLLGITLLVLLATHRLFPARTKRDYYKLAGVLSVLTFLIGIRHHVLRGLFLQTAGGWLQDTQQEEKADPNDPWPFIVPIAEWTFSNPSPFRLYARIDVPELCLPGAEAKPSLVYEDTGPAKHM